LRRLDRGPFLESRVVVVVQGRKAVFDLLKRSNRSAPVVRGGSVEGGAGLCYLRPPQTSIEYAEQGARAQRPKAARSAQQIRDRSALEPSLSIQGEGWKISGARDADLGVGGDHTPLCGRHIRPALEKRGRHTARHLWQLNVNECRPYRKGRGRDADECRNGVFHEGALDAYLRGLRACRIELGLGLRDIQAGGDSGIVALLREAQRPRIGRDGVLENGALVVEATQLHVVFHQLRGERETCILEIRRSRRRVRLSGAHFVANLAPEIELIADGPADDVIIVVVRRRRDRRMKRIMYAFSTRVEAERREEPCARLITKRLRLCVRRVPRAPSPSVAGRSLVACRALVAERGNWRRWLRRASAEADGCQARRSGS